jgi:hypothetical protein
MKFFQVELGPWLLPLFHGSETCRLLLVLKMQSYVSRLLLPAYLHRFGPSA